MKSYLAQCLVLVIAGMVAQEASGAESANSINLGLGGLNPLPHCDARVYMIEYEHQLTPTTTFLGRDSGVHYRYDNGRYMEDGGMRGLDVGARYYPAGGMQGVFIGGTLGYWKEDRTFIQNQNTPDQWQGMANPNSLRLNIDVGDRITIQGTNVSIMPEVNVGKFSTSSGCEATAPTALIGTACSQKPEVNYYLFVGVLVGVAF